MPHTRAGCCRQLDFKPKNAARQHSCLTFSRRAHGGITRSGLISILTGVYGNQFYEKGLKKHPLRDRTAVPNARHYVRSKSQNGVRAEWLATMGGGWWLLFGRTLEYYYILYIIDCACVPIRNNIINARVFRLFRRRVRPPSCPN